MNRRSNEGFVLVLALLLLLIMTIIGISLMSGSQMQERMAGNARLQALAFEGATAGAANAIDFVGVVNTLAPEELKLVCGDSDRDAFEKLWLDNGSPRPTQWIDRGVLAEVSGATVHIRNRLYCLWEGNDDQGRSQLYVESKGMVTTAGTGIDPIAIRNVEVRVVSGRDGALGDPTCSIQTACLGPSDSSYDPLSAFNPPRSRASFVGGDTGHAICACNENAKNRIISEIRENRNENFTGVGGEGALAIGETKGSEPFNDLSAFLAFINALSQIAFEEGTFVDGNYNTLGMDEVRFINGNLEASGSISGSGILVVTGDINLSGNFRYDGMIIGMGELLALRGSGGRDFGVRGTVIAAPIAGWGTDAGPNLRDGVNLSFHETGPGSGAGGGGSSYAFDCDALLNSENLLRTLQGTDADGESIWGDRLIWADPSDNDRVLDYYDRERLGDAPDAEGAEAKTPATDFWQAKCDGGLNIFDSGPAELQLVSWRENLGWRERVEFFSKNEIVLE